MGNIGKRLSALEAHGINREPVNVEIVAGPTIGRREADDRMAPALPHGTVITRIELVGVMPEAKIVRLIPSPYSAVL